VVVFVVEYVAGEYWFRHHYLLPPQLLNPLPMSMRGTFDSNCSKGAEATLIALD